MRHKPNYDLQVERRIFNVRENMRLDMQGLRNKWLTELDTLFDTATAIAKGKVSSAASRRQIAVHNSKRTSNVGSNSK